MPSFHPPHRNIEIFINDATPHNDVKMEKKEGVGGKEMRRRKKKVTKKRE